MNMNYDKHQRIHAPLEKHEPDELITSMGRHLMRDHEEVHLNGQNFLRPVNLEKD